MLTQHDYSQFCMAKGYFTCGSVEQYQRALGLVLSLRYLRGDFRAVKRVISQLAVVTWICSDPDLGDSIVDIERKLLNML